MKKKLLKLGIGILGITIIVIGIIFIGPTDVSAEEVRDPWVEGGAVTIPEYVECPFEVCWDFAWRSVETNDSDGTAFQQFLRTVNNHRTEVGLGSRSAQQQVQFMNNETFRENLGTFCYHSNVIYFLVSEIDYDRAAGVFIRASQFRRGIGGTTNTLAWATNPRHAQAFHSGVGPFNMWELVQASNMWRSGRSVIWCSAAMAIELPPEPCSPTVVDPGPLDCRSNNRDRQLSFVDTTDWDDCIMDSPNHLEEGLGNARYCPVYCREEFRTNLSGMNGISPLPVQAGGHFTWTSHRVQGMRTCRTRGVNWNRFISDLNRANNTVKNRFDEWQQAIANLDAPYPYTTTRRQVNSARSAVRNAESSRDGIITGMRNCSNWDSYENRNKLYNLTTNIDIQYESPRVYPSLRATYRTREQLESSSSSSIRSNTARVCRSHNLTVNFCSSGSCRNENRSVLNCTYNENMVEMERNITLTYNLRDDFYRFVNKETAMAYLRESAVPDNENVIDIGRPNFPIPFGSAPGWYGDFYGRGKLNLYISRTGRQRVDERLGLIIDRQYICAYEVERGPFCPPEKCPPPNDNERGIVYRIIDLNNPFPDMTGVGRRPGDNWCHPRSDVCTHNEVEGNVIVNNVIFNNRNVQTDEVFNQEPMFRFVLTPSIIREIRRENRQTNYAVHTWSAFGKTFPFVCDRYVTDNRRMIEPGGTRCTSGYVTELIHRMHTRGHYDTGVCGLWSPENRRDVFDTCRFEN